MDKLMKTQENLYWEALRKLSEIDHHVMDMINHPTNPITNSDLEKLVARFPERWGRYRGFIGKLPK
jgi:hypothetical protein